MCAAHALYGWYSSISEFRHKLKLKPNVIRVARKFHECNLASLAAFPLKILRNWEIPREIPYYYNFFSPWIFIFYTFETYKFNYCIIIWRFYFQAIFTFKILLARYNLYLFFIFIYSFFIFVYFSHFHEKLKLNNNNILPYSMCK